MKLGCAYDKDTDLGPVVNAGHKEKICNWIQKGIDEGAELVLDGRNVVVPGYENGFFVGPTILDHVTPEMTVGNREIFGPVTCIKRVKDYEEGIAIMNANPFANGFAFIRASPSSKSFTLLISVTGPKISLSPTVMPGFTLSRMVGPTKNPF